MTEESRAKRRLGKPKWLKRSLPTSPGYEKVRGLLSRNRLNTVCQEAKCPNQFECYSQGTSTFMIMGDRCTRNCRFCNVGHASMGKTDEGEPVRVAETVAEMGLRYVVVTSVTRDDYPDGGARFFAKVISEIRMRTPDTLVEVLIPDLAGNWDALENIVEARPDVLNHNIETVSRLYPTVRPGAVYERSLELLRQVKRLNRKIPTKSGIMLGLGEEEPEVYKTFEDLLSAGCDLLTLGQYLQPSKAHLPVERFVTPEEFNAFNEKALALGFAGVAGGPFVRSSYQAERLYREVREKSTGSA